MYMNAYGKKGNRRPGAEYQYEVPHFFTVDRFSALGIVDSVFAKAWFASDAAAVSASYRAMRELSSSMHPADMQRHAIAVGDRAAPAPGALGAGRGVQGRVHWPVPRARGDDRTPISGHTHSVHVQLALRAAHAGDDELCDRGLRRGRAFACECERAHAVASQRRLLRSRLMSAAVQLAERAARAAAVALRADVDVHL